MVVSLNSFVSFTSTANHKNVPRVCIGASMLKSSHFSSPSRTLLISRPIRSRNGRSLLVANGDRLATEISTKTSESTETEPVKKNPEASNGSISASEPIQETDNAEINAIPKRSKLTAREKLRAARVRSRNSEPKPVVKAELGSKVLEALRENDKITGKKRTGLPEAPTNLFDDSKRGMPKKGLTFELPVGWDVFLIILSVVVISTVMFTTTFVVWKMGAIHFNEY
ncbi:uncharacterized protein LOC112527903 [Cynara cardunculus var. scolymus]|uniref:Uncharacterized protein n=1 Tax=Cynara cardunculus var. scolymus TaxID=59895 RepID=A0A103YIW1_CYNCS|nr:uncharacterized protein LOC112527903 [Cynara cardunculus var. scolymus]KVI09929.1 hypothetical protein Ccrd_011670 [Cynara cardunculus var. scolymus]